MQTEITAPVKLLDSTGNVAVPGYGKQNYYVYSRSAIRANPLRIKEWDFYQISDERYTVQITFADISLRGAGSFTLFDRVTGKKYEAASVSLLTLGRMHMPENANEPHVLEVKKSGFFLRADVNKNRRILSGAGTIHGEPFRADLTLHQPEGLEYLTMAVPFKKNGHFYLNQKMNCMPVTGRVCIGSREFLFDPKTAFAVLDWGRGVWPYHCDWYWGNGSCRLPDGKLFGFEIGWGFGDMSAATENMLFYNGKAHKIGTVAAAYDEEKILSPWVFHSDDGRFEMTMTPEYDNYTSSRVLGVVGNRCHQVFGKWNGTAVLDDGRVLTIRDMTAFCEHSDNRW